MSKAKNDRTRLRLHFRQGGLCYYCPRPIGIYVGDKDAPVLEHYIPRSAGGHRCVLACEWCDKKKGMIHGPEFEDIIRRHTVDAGLTFAKAQNMIGAVCKARNVDLQADHVPNILHKHDQEYRSAKIQAQRALWLGAVGVPEQSHFDVGNSGRDKHIAEWEAACAASNPGVEGQPCASYDTDCDSSNAAGPQSPAVRGCGGT